MDERSTTTNQADAGPEPGAPVTGGDEVSPRAPWRGPELVVLDGTATLFRAYYGMRYGDGRTSTDGLEVGAVIGALQLTLGFLRRERPQHVAVVFDSGQQTFRNRIDPRYKANRGDPPDDLEPQFELTRDAFEALGFAVYGVLDYEADDLMATLVRLGRAGEMAVRLVSPDKDLCQLVADAPPPVRLQDPKSGALLDEAGVSERLGVPPARVVDFQALVGDTTDNIAGVRGVGPKAARALLESFGDLDGVYRNLERVQYVSVRGAKALARKLEAARDEAALARRLVALVDTVALDVDAEGLGDETRWMGPRGQVADTLFHRLGTHGLLRGFRAQFERM
ncbi:MAG: hypothetical protein H6713_07760 [Myxococcales bacterium]|nr:hypothetical protein [Myxococcales bacterium]